jgi:hypothetical protein
MRYFIDTEYNWHSASGQIRPLSVGIVAEDGREFYGVANTIHSFSCTPFVKEHVIPVIGDATPKYRSEVGRDIRAFIGDDTPEFWGDYAAFDYVVLSMLMGEFSDWPAGWPMHINDCQQEAVPSLPSATPHNALADARAVRDSWNVAFGGR